MLTEKLAHFYALADQARQKLGDSAPKITDEIIKDAFPRTLEEAEIEGCDKLVREGIVTAVKRYIRKPPSKERQLTFNDLTPDVLPYVADLGSVAYYVPEGVTSGSYVSVPDLCHDLASLDKARKFMRLKQFEVAAEAEKLDRLYDYLRAQEHSA